MIITDNRRKLWEEVKNFQKQILSDPLYNTIHSVKQDNWYLHAKDDYPDIRSKFFEKLRNMSGFESHIVIGRKKLDIFNNKHNNNANEFYFDILYHLLKGRLNDGNAEYDIFLSQRQKINMQSFTPAVEKSISDINVKIQYETHIVKSSVTPELSIIDYLLWALQRYIIQNEIRFYKSVQEKYTQIKDVYDVNGEKEYNSSNIFEIGKAEKFI